MKITPAFKAYLTEKHGLKAGATDDEAKSLTAEKLTKGELTAEDIVKHSVAVDAKSVVNDMVKTAISEQVSPALSAITDSIKELAGKIGEKTPDDVLAEFVEKAAAKALEKAGVKPNGATPFDALNGGRTDVKGVHELYSSSTKQASYPAFTEKEVPHPFAGRPVTYEGETLNEKSKLGMAISGAWFKRMSKNALGSHVKGELSDHDRDLNEYAIRNMEWRGYIGGSDSDPDQGVVRGKLADFQVKALLDDSTSYGTDVVPQVWDEAVVTIPVLYGELYPMVDQQTLDRGRQIHAANMINPTVSVALEDGTSSITLQSTANYFTAILPNVVPLTGAIEMGRDFLSDTPVNVGEIVTKAFGYKTLEWLDNMIANGTGSNQPTGIFNFSGTTAVLPTFPVNGPLMTNDAETLMFGVPLATRRALGARNAYFSNDTTYRRLRSIPIGSDDARRVFGMDHQKYTVLDTPYKIQNNIPDGYVGYANMAYYRMYRRLGMEVQTVTQGQTVVLKNTQLIVVRSRWAGSPMLGSAFALMTNASISG